MKKRAFLKQLGAFSVLCAACAVGTMSAWAQQDYPNKPIRVIVPYPPGGTLDVIARGVGAQIPSLPTMREVGIDNLNADAWIGIVAPVGTPPVIVADQDGNRQMGQSSETGRDQAGLSSNARRKIDIATGMHTFLV